MKFNPRELPKTRSLMMDQLDNRFFKQYLTEFSQDDYLPYRKGGTREERRQTDLENLGRARLYHFSSDMTRLAHSAAESLPGYDLKEWDVPCDHGLMFWDDSPLSFKDSDFDRFKLPICAVSWARLRGMKADDGEPVEGIMIQCFTDRNSVVRMFRASGEIGLQDTKVLMEYMAPVSMALGRYLWVPFSWIPPVSRIDNQLNDMGRMELDTMKAMAVLKSSWLLMAQDGISGTSEVAVPRATAKQLTRLGHPLDAVRVIDLARRPSGTPNQHGDGSTSRYGVRWMVDGHWRNQWYPSLNTHRPKWISAYLKGPEDAPLLTGEKVRTLRGGAPQKTEE